MKPGVRHILPHTLQTAMILPRVILGSIIATLRYTVAVGKEAGCGPGPGCGPLTLFFRGVIDWRCSSCCAWLLLGEAAARNRSSVQAGALSLLPPSPPIFSCSPKSTPHCLLQNVLAPPLPALAPARSLPEGTASHPGLEFLLQSSVAFRGLDQQAGCKFIPEVH